jgi:hypothetical protein
MKKPTLPGLIQNPLLRFLVDLREQIAESVIKPDAACRGCRVIVRTDRDDGTGQGQYRRGRSHDPDRTVRRT